MKTNLDILDIAVLLLGIYTYAYKNYGYDEEYCSNEELIYERWQNDMFSAEEDIVNPIRAKDIIAWLDGITNNEDIKDYYAPIAWSINTVREHLKAVAE